MGGPCAEHRVVVEDKIKFRESTKRDRQTERKKEREVQIEFRVEKSWRVRRDDADDPPGLEISPSLDVGGRERRRRRRLVTLVVDVAAPGVATLIDSRGPAPSTDVPVTSLESRHPLRPTEDSTTPLWNLVLLRRVYSNGDAPCASPMNSKGLMADFWEDETIG